MEAIWSILVVLLSNVLIWVCVAAAAWGSWLVTQRIRGNQSISNLTCRVALGAIFAVGIFILYNVSNWITTTIVPPQSIVDEFSLALLVAVLLNLITTLVVPIFVISWTLFALVYVGSDRCPRCHYTAPTVLREAVRRVVVKTTKTTKYKNGRTERKVSYEDQDQIDYTMKCPRCGAEWHSEGLHINRRW